MARGFIIVSGSDEGFLGDGQFVLASEYSPLTFRVSRGRNEELIEFSFRPDPTENDWFDIGYAQLLREPGSADGYMRLPHALEAKAPILMASFAALEAAVRNDAADTERRILEDRRRLNAAWISSRSKSRDGRV
jgi:hypothetical protein